MKTIKKILLILILIFVIYIVLIFIKPDIADKIAETLNIKNFNEKIRIIKKGLDIFSTKIPSKEEIQESYSGAKEKIEEIKKTIDTVRKNTNNLKEKYNETKEIINNTSKKIEQIKQNLNNLEETGKNISNLVNKDIMK